jgi:uncharacterized protein (DUF2062 family)
MKFWNSIAIGEFFDRALVRPLISFLKQGLSPQKLALSVALGVSLGIFPVLGTTTILCGVVAVAFRLNMPAIQLINYFSSPLQFFFIIPFIRFGEFLFNETPFPLDVFQIISMIQSNMLEAIHTLWWTTMHAIVAWLIVGPLVSAVLYFILLPIFIRLVQRTAEQ